MPVNFNDPFDALFALQRALDARLGSEWMGRGTPASGSYPPVNIFQQGDDFIAVLEAPGVSKDNLAIEAKENTIRISGRKAIDYGGAPVFIAGSACPGCSTARSPFRSTSIRIPCVPNIMTAY
jgi:hypothetical protein